MTINDEVMIKNELELVRVFNLGISCYTICDKKFWVSFVTFKTQGLFLELIVDCILFE